MASMGVVTEVGPDLYAPRPLSEKMIIPEYQDSIRFWFVFLLLQLTFHNF